MFFIALLLFQLSVGVSGVEWVSQVDPERINNFIEMFRGLPVGPSPGYDRRMQLLANLTREHFNHLNLTVLPDEERNVVGVKLGTASNPKAVLVSAHFRPRPTVTDEGLDDNASGMGVLFELAKIISETTFENSVIFVAFNDYCGNKFPAASAHWVESHESLLSNLVVALNIDSVGNYNDTPGTGALPPVLQKIFPEATADIESEQNRGNYIFAISDDKSRDFATTLKKNGMTQAPGFHLVPTIFPGSGLDLCNKLPPFCLSDHGNFWANGYPALHISDMARNSLFNLDFVVNITKTVLATIADLSQ